MIEIPRIQPAAPTAPAWWPFVTGRAMVRCCNGHDVPLVVGPEDHAIAADGAVTPSLLCPIDGCGWHEFVRLADWPE